MHTSRATLSIVSLIGLISTLFTWRYYDQVAEAAEDSGLTGMLNASGFESKMVAENGFEITWGYGTLGLFLLIILFSVIGKRKESFAAGSSKFALLIISATNVVYHIIAISVILLMKFHSPAYGLYVAFSCALIALIIPYLFNKKGDFDPMSPKEIADDIEDSADDFEDKADDLGDKIEDSIEDKFKKADKKAKSGEEKVKEDTEKVVESVDDKVEETENKIEKAADKVKEDMKKAVDSISDKAEELGEKIDETGKEITGSINEKAEETFEGDGEGKDASTDDQEEDEKKS